MTTSAPVSVARDQLHIAERRVIPWYVWITALLVALLHMAPYWRAQAQTPPGWSFTGNINVSPDMMQYRVWMRQAQESGLLVSNRFTTEPNAPHLPVLLYFLVGKLAQGVDVPPEFVNAYLGAVFAFLLALLLYVVIRQFSKTPYQAWWVFLAVLVGGGLGGYLHMISDTPALVRNGLIYRLVVDPTGNAPLLDSYRGNYVFTALGDTHFLAFWLATTGAIYSLYRTIANLTPWRVLLTAFLCLIVTLLHLYEGILLISIMAGVMFVMWRRRLPLRAVWITSAVSAAIIVICLGWQISLYRSSGLPLPTWVAPNITVVALFLGFPLAWLLIAWGVVDYWRHAGFDQSFLLGWVLGCLVLVLSWPFYPYPDRGIMTLQVAVTILAGAIYFSRFRRVTPILAVLAVLLLAGTPVRSIQVSLRQTAFSPDKPYMFLSEDQRDIIDTLRQRATVDDVLILDKTAPGWATDDLWLMPEYPGKLYAGHFFLTPDYETKRAEVNRFFRSSAAEQLEFLQKHAIRFVYVDAQDDPGRFTRVPDLVPVQASSVGTLYEFVPQSAGGG